MQRLRSLGIQRWRMTHIKSGDTFTEWSCGEPVIKHFYAFLHHSQSLKNLITYYQCERKTIHSGSLLHSCTENNIKCLYCYLTLFKATEWNDCKKHWNKSNNIWILWSEGHQCVLSPCCRCFIDYAPNHPD